jgi:hypothetical protein
VHNTIVLIVDLCSSMHDATSLDGKLYLMVAFEWCLFSADATFMIVGFVLNYI